MENVHKHFLAEYGTYCRPKSDVLSGAEAIHYFIFAIWKEEIHKLIPEPNKEQRLGIHTSLELSMPQ